MLRHSGHWLVFCKSSKKQKYFLPKTAETKLVSLFSSRADEGVIGARFSIRGEFR